MNVEPSVTNESKRLLRRHAAKAPSRVPTTKEMIRVTPTSTRVHGSATPITVFTS